MRISLSEGSKLRGLLHICLTAAAETVSNSRHDVETAHDLGIFSRIFGGGELKFHKLESGNCKSPPASRWIFWKRSMRAFNGGLGFGRIEVCSKLR